ncbi:hypothetical protein FRD82_16235, partial [Mycobacterium tuberculosis]
MIIELMRRVVGLAQGATAEVAVYGDRDRDLAERWCANTGNTLVRADVDQTTSARTRVFPVFAHHRSA